MRIPPFVASDRLYKSDEGTANALGAELWRHAKVAKGCEKGIFASVGCNLTSIVATTSMSSLEVLSLSFAIFGVGWAKARMIDDCAAISSKVASLAPTRVSSFVISDTTRGASQS